MREVISVHLGQTGVQIGNALWELFCLEHGVPSDGVLQHRLNYGTTEDVEMRQNCLQNTCTGDLSTEPLFNDSSNGRLVPRALFLDLEPTVIDEIRTGHYRQLFHPDQLITGKDDASSNYARGRFTTGKLLLTMVMDQIRRLLEASDSPAAFLLYHSHGGGTGSGFGSLLMDNLVNDVAKLSKINFMLYPSTAMSNSVVEPYNAVMSLENSINKSDCTIHMENAPLYALCLRCLNVYNPTYTSINRLCAQVISTLTASLRFFNSDSMDVWQLQTNLVPYPKIHFPLVAFAPVLSAERLFHGKITATSVTQDLFDPRSQFVDCDTRQGKFMASCVCYRGPVSIREVNEAISDLKKAKEMRFVDWCPTGFKLNLNRYAPVRVPGSDLGAVKISAAMITNTTAVNESFARLIRKFSLMHNMRAYVHWYVGEGMEEGEFIEAKESVLSLENDYKELAVPTEGEEQEGDEENSKAPSEVKSAPRAPAPAAAPSQSNEDFASQSQRSMPSQPKSASVHSRSEGSQQRSAASKSRSDAAEGGESAEGEEDNPEQEEGDEDAGADENDENDAGGDENDGGGDENEAAETAGGAEENEENEDGGNEDGGEDGGNVANDDNAEPEPEEAANEESEAEESQNASAVRSASRRSGASNRSNRSTGLTFREALAKHRRSDQPPANKSAPRNSTSSNNSVKSKPAQSRVILKR